MGEIWNPAELNDEREKEVKTPPMLPAEQVVSITAYTHTHRFLETAQNFSTNSVSLLFLSLLT